jgi:hypothetical protein
MILVVSALAFLLIRDRDENPLMVSGAGMVIFVRALEWCSGPRCVSAVLAMARRPNVPIHPRQIVWRTSIGMDGSGKAIRKRCATSETLMT